MQNSLAVGSSQIISILLVVRVEIDTWGNEEDAKTSKSNFNLNVSLFSLDMRLFPPLKHNCQQVSISVHESCLACSVVNPVHRS